MRKAAYGIQWIPCKLVESFLTTNWMLLDYTSNKISYDKITEERPEVMIAFALPEQLRSLESIKWILTPGAGIDSMPIEKIKIANQKLVNCHANSQSVAEHAWALLLSVVRNIPKFDQKIRELSDWPPTSHILEKNTDLGGKTLGILGYGSIGKKIIKFAHAFDMEIIIFRKNPEEGQYSFLELGEKADEIDILIVACPLTEKTKGLVNEKIIAKLPAHAYVINIARGEIIEEKAMFEALRTGGLKGAGIDTWSNSPYQRTGGIAPKEFVDIENLVISPHRAFVSMESYAMVAQQIAKNLDQIAKGMIPEDVLDLTIGY